MEPLRLDLNWQLPNLARHLGVSEADLWTALVALVQWRASAPGSVHIAAVTSDDRAAPVAMGSVEIDPDTTIPNLVTAVRGSLSTDDPTGPDVAVQQGCDVAVLWDCPHAFDVSVAHLVAAVCPDPSGAASVSYFWDPDRFDARYVTIWHDHLNKALQSLADNPGQLVSELSLVTEQEKDLIAGANATAHPITDCLYVHDLLDRSLARFPDRVALSWAEGFMTYTELGERVNALAGYLRQTGVWRGDAIALMADRGPELVIGMLAILKAGGVIVPVSTAYPPTRTEIITADADARIALVSNPAYRDLLPAQMVTVDLKDPVILAMEAIAVEPVNQPDDLCCILYTSGTSGMPKGVRVKHSTIVNAAESCREEWQFGSSDVEPQFAPATFIAAINEIAFGIAAGGHFLLPGDDIIKDPRAFTMYAIRNGVTHIVTTPDYAQYIAQIPTVRTVVTLGAKCPPEVSAHLSQYQHINVYGLTEAGLALYWPRNPGQPIPKSLPIGRPIWNTQAHVLRDGTRCGVYMPGELCLTGACVAAGYNNLPDLDAERFTPNPFGAGTMFHTGDIVQWNADGNLEYLGRSDEQVQIHGQRVELGEVEHAILGVTGISQCCAIPCTDTGNNQSIAAFIVADLPVDCTALRARLTQRMVSYMVPARLVQIDDMPRTPNGKYDKRALLSMLDPLPLAQPGTDRDRDGSGALEAIICSIIEQILPGGSVSPADNFFSLGGDSLSGVRFANELQERTGIQVPLLTLFQHPTPRELTQALYAQMDQQFAAGPGQRIASVGGAGVYPASSSQQRLFVVDQLDQEGLAYHIPAAVHITGHMDPERLQQIFQQLVDRHEVLRTTFRTDSEGHVLQEIHEHVHAAIEVIQAGDVSDQAVRAIVPGFVRRFDLGQAPLVRVMLAQGPGEESLLVFDGHHIVVDGSSMTILVDEFSRLYRGETLPPPGAQYKDYAAWSATQDTTAAKQYWTTVFADPPAALDMPTDYPRPLLQTFTGASLTRMIPEATRAKVDQIARQFGATEAEVLMAAWGAVLGRYGRTSDLVIGMPVSGRVHPDTAHMLGMFVTTVPIRVRPRLGLPFEQFVDQVRDSMATGLTYQGYPLEDILGQIGLDRDVSRNPLFDTVLVFQNFTPANLELAGLDARVVPVGTLASNLDVSVYVTPMPGAGYQVVMEYRTDLFTPATIDYLFRHLQTFLDNAAATQTPVGMIEMIDAEEQGFLGQLNDTAAAIRDDVTVVDLFDEQVASQPDSVAVVCAGAEWTYRQLDAQARRVGARLRAEGVRAGDYVALLTARSNEMAAAILGVLKAGAGYVPISLDTPAARMAAIVDACRPAAVIVSATSVPDGVDLACPVIDMAEFGDTPGTLEDTPGADQGSDLGDTLGADPGADQGFLTGEHRVGSEDPAYCIFTSGSTGVPKGVVITHKSLSGFAQDPQLYDLLHHVSKPRFIATADYSFDMSVTEWFAGICQGIPVVIATDSQCVNQQEFASVVRSSNATIIQATPTRMRMLTEDPDDRDYLNGIEVFLLGGEVVPEDLVQMLAECSPGRAQIMYGPTEDTVWATTGEWTPGQPVTIGRPLANQQVYVVGATGGQCGIGVPGEICVGGAGLAEGYLGDPELTADKFVPNPFGRGRLYHTGDLARWCPDGNLRFLGRIDTQVKVHGVRIETGEVEHVIRDYPGVADGVVVARLVGCEPVLCAYYVPDPDTGVEPDGLRAFVSSRLPHAMVPSYWTSLDSLPVNRSGKIDTASLPTPEIHHAGYVRPSTPAEQIVAEAICHVLGVDKVGVHDDFFALGGDSLKAMRLANQIEARTGARLKLHEVFSNPTVDGLAALIAGQTAVFEPITRVPGSGMYPASSPQRRLFIVDQLDREGLAYHTPVVVRITGRVDPDVLQQVFQESVDRHEVLRTSFTTDANGQVMQQIHDRVDAALSVVHADDVGDDAVQDIVTGFVRPFDLGEAPLIRMMLVLGPDDESLVVVDAHHIILDGTSMTILIDEFSRLYRGETLPPVGAEYKDYEAWLAARDGQPAQQYWTGEFTDPPTALDLPTDHPRPALQTFTGATLTRTIPARIRTRVQALARRAGATEAMVLMAAWGAVLGQYGRSSDLVIGMPVSGRVHPDTEHMLGMFVNTLPIRLRPHEDIPFEEFLGQVRATMMAGLTYQSYPLEDILDQVDLPRDLSRNPLFDTVMVVQNFAAADLETTGLDAQLVDSHTHVARFDLSVSVTPVTQAGYTVQLEYRTDLFTAQTTDYYFRHLQTFLDRATESPQTVLGAVSLIDTDEHALLDSLNDTAMTMPDETTIAERFAHVVSCFPDKEAMVCDDFGLTYRELDERVRHIASRLREMGVGRDDLVGIYAGRGLPLFEAVLGVIVSGGAYLPLDPQWPDMRLTYVLGDAKPKVILVNGSMPPIDPGVPVLDLADTDLYAGPVPVLDPVNQPTDLAYCIYTSGSTGEPKGVLIEHLGVCNLVNVAKQYGVTADDRTLHYASIAFDASVEEWVQALLVGGTLIVPTDTEVNDTAWLSACLRDDATVVTLPPMIIPHLDITNLPRLISAGTQARAVPGFTGEFVNGYGPTEATVCSTLWTRAGGGSVWPDPVPIGGPRANLSVYLLNESGTLCGIGVPGEICVAGVGLARGYLGDPELTSIKFVPNPFGRGRLYHTGDMACWQPDGNLRFLGRIDAQVKVHGIRIEPGEVEQAIRDCPGVVDTFVVARPDQGGEMALCAYYVTDGEDADETACANRLRAFVSQRLPRTMVPSYWTKMDSLPVNRSGKIDADALPIPDIHHAGYVEPHTPAEQVIAEAIATVLGVDRVGARDDFFALGGDSLKAMQLVNQIEARTGVRIGLRDVFLNPRVDALALVLSSRGGIFEPIVSVGGAGIYPASSVQRRLFVVDQLDQGGLAYHLPVMLRIRAGVDQERLQQVFQHLVDRHEVLRTSFFTDSDGQVMQRIDEHIEVTLETARADDVSDEPAQQILARFVRPFNLGEAPLIRLMLVQGPPDESLLLFDAHHIILDGTSMTQLVEEFSGLYKGEDFPPAGVDYKDYTAWLGAQDMGPAQKYWTDVFADPPAVLDFPTDHPRPALQTFAGATLTGMIPASIRGQAEEIARRSGTTEAMVMMAAWGAVLARYSTTEDLVVGMPVSGRVHPDTETMLGMFVNTVPVRLHPRPDMTFEEYLGEVRDTMVTGLTYQSYPLEDILEKIDLPRDLSRNPLFDTVLVFQNFSQPDLDTTGLDAQVIACDTHAARFDLSATITPVPGAGYKVELAYRTDLFTQATMSYLFRHLRTFLDRATASWQTPLGAVSLINTDEHALLDSLNDTAMTAPDETTIAERFAHVVRLFPDKEAMVCDGFGLTYRELDERVRHIAARLREMGVGRDDLVGIYAGRGLPLFEAVLGVIVSGGAYLPLDPQWPNIRLEYVLGDAKPKAILVNGSMPPFDPGVPVLDLADTDLYTGPAPVLGPVNQPTDLAYCIYTSGSTGVPKGVLIEHLGVCNLVTVATQCGITSEDRVLQYASLAFDASVWEWTQTLLVGGTLIVPTDTEVNDTAWLSACLRDDATVVTLPPMIIPHLDVHNLPRLISAGTQARAVPGFTGEFVNGYGPTEATVCSTLWTRAGGGSVWPDPVPIGRPRANLCVYLVDPAGRLCAVGVPGEICVAGVGLARGYLGDPELTSTKFVPNPFGRGRLYHTGDMACWQPDGNLRFLGRIDAQIKVNGVRIEPGEVEQAIRDCPGVTDAVAVARPTRGGDVALCAYYVTDPDTSVDSQALRMAVSQRLPRTMVPSYWTEMDSLPVNRSGKVDTAALPDPEARFTGYAEPSTPAEQMVADAITDVVGVDRVGARDDFFALGGDSLKAMQLVNQIQARTGVRLSLQEVFQNPSVDGLALAMSGRAVGFEPIVSAGGAGVYPASSPQRRLFVIDRLDPQGLAYHVPVMLRVRGRMDPVALGRVFQELVDRHEVLRTSFTTGAEGQVLQEIHGHSDATVEVIQIDDVSDEGAQQVFTGFVRPFDLGQAPLVRVMLAEGPNDESLLLFDAHHIILDGTSMTQLVEEFSQLYCGGALAPEGVEYKDYSAWFSAQDMTAARRYWTGIFAEPPAQLDLPTDHPRPALQTFTGATLTRTIPAPVRTGVEEAARRNGATEAMVVMSAWGAVLARYGRTDDLVVGMPVSGRIHPDTEHMLGMFVNTVPIRVRPHPDEPFDRYLCQVRDAMVTGLTYQSYPLEDILADINLPRDLSRNPLFDTVLVFQNFAQPELNLTGLDARVVPSDKTGANLDVSVYVTPISQGGYQVDMEYRTDVFDPGTIDYFFRHLQTFLERATASPDTPVGEVSMIDDDEMSAIDSLNDTTDALRDVTVVDLFDEQVAAGPHMPAVVMDNKKWTYQDLDVRARQIAAQLRGTGVAHGQFVALLTTRSFEMVAAIAGVLKAGAGYVPISPDLPGARVDAMMNACRPAAILTFGANLPDGVRVECPVIDLAAPVTTESEAPGQQTPPGLDDPAYCIFTSGSTGVPKGVVITHRSLSAFAQEPRLQDLIHGCGHPMFAAASDYSFDISGTEFFPGLCRGVPIMVATESQCVDQRGFAGLVESGATIVQATPTRLRMLTADPADRDYLGQVELFLIGGESVPEDLLRLLSHYSPAPIWIMYGPTETTVWSTMGRWVPGHPVTIGRPLAGEQVYIRDGSGGRCGIGVPGELCVAGVGLARGYLGDPELTGTKFVANPFGNHRIYRTGDLGLLQVDGNLRFLGRIDTQVKVHGIRIETEEVEHVIRDCPGILDAVVAARTIRGGETALCAYVTTDPQWGVTMEELRGFVAERLPRTMVPAYWTHMDRLPVNRSGKTDRGALPDPQVHFAEYAAPATPTECLVAEVMGQVLGVDQIGVHDDFFALGGDSLKALQLVNQLQAHAGAHLQLQDVFQNPRVDGLANLVQNHGGAFEPIVSVGGAGIYPTTTQQLQMLNDIDDNSYHITMAVRIHGRLNQARTRQVFQQLVDYHEALRTAFLTGLDGQVVQEVRDHVDAVIDVTEVEDVSDETAKKLLADFTRPFDLSEPPLFRLLLAEAPGEQSLVLIDGHHVILDGSSMTILIEEFCRLYAGKPLPPVKAEYKDYSVWFAAQDPAPAEHFWSTLLKDLPPALEMPFDYPRPALLTFTDEGVTRQFSAELRAQVNSLAHKTGTTEAMVVFAGLGAVLGRYAHTEDLVIGMTVSGRNHPDTKDMLGVFANALPLRLRPRLTSSFEKYLRDVRDTMVPAMTYQDYSYRKVVELVRPPMDPSRLPLMDVIFAFQNFTQPDIDLPGITAEIIPSEDTGVGIDLAIFTLPKDGGGYETTFDYRSDLYKPETIESVFSDWEAFLAHVTASPQTLVGEVPLSGVR